MLARGRLKGKTIDDQTVSLSGAKVGEPDPAFLPNGLKDR